MNRGYWRKTDVAPLSVADPQLADYSGLRGEAFPRYCVLAQAGRIDIGFLELPQIDRIWPI